MNLLDIYESNNDLDIEYEVMAGKVIARLRSYESAAFTRLAKKIEHLKQLEEETKALKEEVKSLTREHIAALFKAEHAVDTRIVETMSVVFTMSKDPKPTETYQYSKILDELTVHLTPELIAIKEDIKQKYKTIVQKEPSLSIKRKEDLEESTVSHYYRKFLNFINVWGKRYDQQLDQIKKNLRSSTG